jgi:predicted DNA-binding protein (MmcQ/YjbR family)
MAVERGQRELGEQLLDMCQGLPDAELTFPFGVDTAVYKVGGKMFALFDGPVPGAVPSRVSVKCDPEYAAALVRDHAAITPGYHLNKRHWITLDLTADPPAELAADLMEDSYDLVVEGLPRAKRPVR